MPHGLTWDDSDRGADRNARGNRSVTSRDHHPHAECLTTLEPGDDGRQPPADQPGTICFQMITNCVTQA